MKKKKLKTAKRPKKKTELQLKKEATLFDPDNSPFKDGEAFIIGIDPGKKGGIAFVSCDRPLIKLAKLPNHGGELLAHIKNAKFGFIETNSMMRNHAKKGVVTFCEDYGRLRGIFEAADISHMGVPPKTWQAFFGLDFNPPKPIGEMTKKEEGQWYTYRKNAHLKLAKELYPHLYITQATADALLIAVFGEAIYTRGTSDKPGESTDGNDTDDHSTSSEPRRVRSARKSKRLSASNKRDRKDNSKAREVCPTRPPKHLRESYKSLEKRLSRSD